jgi:hypothetical protein
MVRGRGNLLRGLLAGLLVLLGTVIAIPLNVVSGYFPAAVASHRPLWISLAGCGALAIVALTWLSQRSAGQAPEALMGQVPPVADWV